MAELVHRSRMAGTWYPAQRGALDELLDQCLDEAPSHDDLDASNALRALVVPHAGIRYSGPVAAAAYRLLANVAFDGVLLLGPHHRGGDGLFLMPEGSIETPLGAVKIDSDLSSQLARASTYMRYASDVHREEHSLEMQYPFLQRFLPNATLTPVLMGYQTPETIAAASAAIESVLRETDRRVLLIASSDLSHFEPRPIARELDSRGVKCLREFDVAALARLLESRDDHACGGGPMMAVLQAAKALGASRSRVLAYGDSGDVTGDMTGVVGYVAAAVMDA